MNRKIKISCLGTSLLFHVLLFLPIVVCFSWLTKVEEQERVVTMRLVEVSYVKPVHIKKSKHEDSLSRIKKRSNLVKIPDSNNVHFKKLAGINNPTITKIIKRPVIHTSDHRVKTIVKHMSSSIANRKYKPFELSMSRAIKHDRRKVIMAKMISSVPTSEHVGDNTHDMLSRYRNSIKKLINSHKIYPRIARRKGIEGVVMVSFVILRNGLLKDIRLITSSNYEILDKAALETINNANPFLPFPDSIDKKELWLKLALSFRLDG
jgi:TonB family protein